MKTATRDFEEAMDIGESVAFRISMLAAKMLEVVDMLRQEKIRRIASGEPVEAVDRRLMKTWAEFIGVVKEQNAV